GYGMTPATFTTTNPVVMRMIEESSYFRNGKIRLIDKAEETEVEQEGKLSRMLREIREREAQAGKTEDCNSGSSTRKGATFKKEKR
ncbi:MAG: hypothetical protein K2L89_01755, partial [Muribaculaceae bacterium]|nr:hypothetical protein [Muribaculaceae bacterium]